MPKDLFSEQSKDYARYRPSYPKELFDYILQFVEERNFAWDCATGNGQAAVLLSSYFKNVEATDLSEAQIRNAVHKPNIIYRVGAAEETEFKENTFDLITVAQAYHWIDQNKFQKEVTRVAKPNAVVAVWVYNLFTSDDEYLDKLLKRFYFDIVGIYWDAERKYVDENYETISFEFAPLPSKTFETRIAWKRDDFIGYLSSWSSVQHYFHHNKTSALSLIIEDLESIWKEGEEKQICFPIYLRLGRILK
jgi:ubiquinone/menaquinone biosynthesis C-methylase UbiE